jgi:hypothetical protein
LEKTDGEPVDALAMTNNLVQISFARSKKAKRSSPGEFKDLVLCRGCDRHVLPETRVCPFCQGDVKALQKQHDKRLREARKAYQRLLTLLHEKPALP